MAWDEKAYKRKYYQKNKERIKKYYQEHKEEKKQRRESSPEYYKKHKEQILKYNKWWRENSLIYKLWYQKNKEKTSEYKRQWRKNNPENDSKYYIKNKKRILEYRSKWIKTEKGKAYSQRMHSKRKAREKNIINTLTAEEWIDILKKYEFRCAYCGKEFTLFDRETHDHIIPLSKGGHNIKENVVPACQSCNSKKYNKLNYAGVI